MTLVNRTDPVPPHSGKNIKEDPNPLKAFEMSLQRHVEAFNQVQGAKNSLVEALVVRKDHFHFQSLINQGLEDLLEDPLYQTIKPLNINGLKIASVDGGLQTREFSNFQFILARAIGGVFTFRGNRSPLVKYYPDESQNFRLEVIHRPMSTRGFDFNASIERAFMEVELVNRILKVEPDLDLLILDGSILVEPLDIFFRNDGDLLSRYNQLLLEYYKLYRVCLNNDILVAGCVKDSHSRRLTSLIQDVLPMLMGRSSSLQDLLEYDFRDILSYFRDEELFQALLDHGQRSCVFQYSADKYDVTEDVRGNSLLARLPINFYGFYGKFAEWDVPLRVEFFAREDPEEIQSKADTLAALLFPLSSHHRQYAVPVPQIEVHRRAKISPHEMELHLRQFLQRLDPRDALRLLGPRRNRRPFD